MCRYFLLSITLFIVNISSFASSGKIKAYFNTPVDTTFARNGNNAVYLNYTLDDTMVAYINRATISLDIAIYQLSQESGMADIVGAINSAYSRGVVVRVIYDGKDNASTSISSLNSGIHTLASPSTSAYNIMHNKFMIIDAGDVSKAIVWTGSTNWSELMFDRDVNNAVIIQDQPLAQAYVAEFNQMWGSTTATPNAAASKFGPYKTATTAHTFTVDGKTIELYFSPSDGTNSQIYNAITTADKELFFGVYTFTESNDATGISSKHASAGMTVKGIMDNYSVAFSAYSILNPAMGADLKVYHQSGTVYHTKMMVIDPDYPALDPLVLTGSHNWSATADTKNDENTLIIHDSTLANQYLQSFAAGFKSLGGVITPVQQATGIGALTGDVSVRIYPNPAQDHVNIDITGTVSDIMVELTDISGHLLYMGHLLLGSNSVSLCGLDSGMYLVRVSTSSSSEVCRVVKFEFQGTVFPI